MTPEEIRALTAPVSEEEPCGPDLEAIGDADYMRFVTRIEVLLPKSFADFERDRGAIDFKSEFAIVKGLLNRSRDLRLLTFLAKLLILNRDLAAFVVAVQTIRALAETRWPEVHPQLLDGDAILRIISVQTLDDMPDTVMPLQSAPLFETRRYGKLSYRAWLLASGKIAGRTAANENEKDEDVPSLDNVRTALADADLARMVAARGLAIDLRDALGGIELTVNEKSGQPGAVKFEKLKPLAVEIATFLDETVAARDPSQALTPAESGTGEAEDEADAPGAAAGGAMLSLADARSAFAAAAGYFRQSEPSSPVLLLIAQAEALIGKSFFAAMQALIPDLSGQAALRVGRDLNFRLPIERLSEIQAAAESGQAESAASDGSEEAAGDSSDGGEQADEAGESQPSQDVGARAHSAKRFRAATRQEAVALLDQIATFFRAVEPSSPIPTLLEHGRALAGRDFFGLLREVLPASALRVDE